GRPSTPRQLSLIQKAAAYWITRAGDDDGEHQEQFMSNAPHYEIDVAKFWADPYPDLARMRKQAPIAFVPQLGSTVFTRRDDIFSQEKRTDVFSSHQPAGLMNLLMGHNMMRKDGDAHMTERAAMFPSVSPRAVRDTL